MAWDIQNELTRYGPQSPPFSGGLSAARAYCRNVCTQSYENFSVASFLLPRLLQPHFHAVYAFCRWADDLADETKDDQALELLSWWRAELQACYSGQPSHPVTIALRVTIHKFQIPADEFLDLIHAFEQDQRIKQYETFDQLVDYCRRSANPVGRIVLHLYRCHTSDRQKWSDEICTGLQLANFWQDVARDWAIGRCYIPREDRIRFGYSDEHLSAQRFTNEFRELLRFQVDRTRGFFHRGRPLLPSLPWRARLNVDLFIRGGEAVLNAIERGNYDVWANRPIISKRQKILIMAKAILGLPG